VNGDPVAKLRAHLRNLYCDRGSRQLRLEPADQVRHAVTYRAITIKPFRINVRTLPRILGAESIPLEDVSELPVSNLTRKVARAVLAAANRSAANHEE
jgi:hypothetical protein